MRRQGTDVRQEGKAGARPKRAETGRQRDPGRPSCRVSGTRVAALSSGSHSTVRRSAGVFGDDRRRDHHTETRSQGGARRRHEAAGLAPALAAWPASEVARDPQTQARRPPTRVCVYGSRAPSPPPFLKDLAGGPRAEDAGEPKGSKWVALTQPCRNVQFSRCLFQVVAA